MYSSTKLVNSLLSHAIMLVELLIAAAQFQHQFLLQLFQEGKQVQDLINELNSFFHHRVIEAFPSSEVSKYLFRVLAGKFVTLFAQMAHNRVAVQFIT